MASNFSIIVSDCTRRGAATGPISRRRCVAASLAVALVLLSALSLSAGCSRYKVQYAAFSPRAFPPTDRARVQVLFEKPSRPYVEIGSLTVQGYPDTPVSELIATVVSTAAERGADAVIVSNRESISPRTTRIGGETRLSRPNLLRAVAIRFPRSAAPQGPTETRGAPRPVR